MKEWSVKIFGVVAMAVLICLGMLIISGTAFADLCVDNGDGTVTDEKKHGQTRSAFLSHGEATVNELKTRLEGFTQGTLPLIKRLGGMK